MKLKHGDAVKCETKEQWAEIVKECILKEIYIGSVVSFESFPYLYVAAVLSRTKKESETLQLRSSNWSYEKSMLSYPEFLSKLKGEWQEPTEIKMEIGKDYETGDQSKARLIADLREINPERKYPFLFYHFKEKRIFSHNGKISPSSIDSYDIIGEWEEEKKSLDIFVDVDEDGANFSDSDDIYKLEPGLYKLVRCEDE